jgi:hypothetical protein
VRRKEALVRQVRRLFRARVRHASARRGATIAVAAIFPSVPTPHPPPRAPRPTERERAAAAARSRRSSVGPNYKVHIQNLRDLMRLAACARPLADRLRADRA